MFTIKSDVVETIEHVEPQVIDWGTAFIRAPEVWKETKGLGIKVAILDTGLDKTHDDLRHCTIQGYNFTTGHTEDWDDRSGHGTHCAGIIAAVKNDFGIVGIAPDVELYVGKVMGDDGNGSREWLIRGIDWAIECGVDILSLSLGASKDPGPDFHAAIKRARAAGIILVSASGNQAGDLSWPAAYEEVISVGAIDDAINRAAFSNTGESLDFTAPGVDILSTYPKNRYAKLSGTSMATPIVVGLIALIQSYARSEGFAASPEVLKEMMVESAIDIGPDGRDREYGHGIINVGAVIESINEKLI